MNSFPFLKDLWGTFNSWRLSLSSTSARLARATPTRYDIERGLVDKRDYVRFYWVNRSDFTPNAAQVERGLTDKNFAVRWAWVSRLDFSATPMQTERALGDDNFSLRGRWLESPEIVISLETLNQVVAGLDELQLSPLSPDIEQRLRAQAEAEFLIGSVGKDQKAVAHIPARHVTF